MHVNVWRRDFLKLIPAAAAASSMSGQTKRRPNIIVFVTDDHGIGDVGCYGHPEVKTPNLDRLAASGVRFTQWYANAPICSASRAAILTGKYPDRAGVKGALPSEPTWDVAGAGGGGGTPSRVLRKPGYRPAADGNRAPRTGAPQPPPAPGGSCVCRLCSVGPG